MKIKAPDGNIYELPNDIQPMQIRKWLLETFPDKVQDARGLGETGWDALVRGGHSLGSSFAFGVPAMVQDMLGNDMDAADDLYTLRKIREETELEHPRRYEDMIQGYQKDGIGGLGISALETLGEQTPNLAALVGATAVGGPLGGLSAAAGLNFPESYERATQQVGGSLSGSAQWTPALLAGAAKTVLDSALPFALVNRLSPGVVGALEQSIASKILQRSMGREAAASWPGRLVSEGVYSSVIEGATEGLQEFIDQLAEKAINGQPFNAQDMHNIMVSGLAGGLVGGVAGGGIGLASPSGIDSRINPVQPILDQQQAMYDQLAAMKGAGAGIAGLNNQLMSEWYSPFKRDILQAAELAKQNKQVVDNVHQLSPFSMGDTATIEEATTTRFPLERSTGQQPFSIGATFDTAGKKISETSFKAQKAPKEKYGKPFKSGEMEAGRQTTLEGSEATVEAPNADYEAFKKASDTLGSWEMGRLQLGEGEPIYEPSAGTEYERPLAKQKLSAKFKLPSGEMVGKPKFNILPEKKQKQKSLLTKKDQKKTYDVPPQEGSVIPNVDAQTLISTEVDKSFGYTELGRYIRALEEGDQQKETKEPSTKVEAESSIPATKDKVEVSEDGELVGDIPRQPAVAESLDDDNNELSRHGAGIQQPAQKISNIPSEQKKAERDNNTYREIDRLTEIRDKARGEVEKIAEELKKRGPQGEKAFRAFNELLNRPELTAEQTANAFTAAAMYTTLPKDANTDIVFMDSLSNVADTAPEAFKDSGGIKGRGIVPAAIAKSKTDPTKTLFLWALDHNEDPKSYASHEAFHIFQNYISKHSPRTWALLKREFGDPSKKISEKEIPASIKRVLSGIRTDGGSAYEGITERLNNSPEGVTAHELMAYTYQAWQDGQGGPLPGGVKAFFNGVNGFGQRLRNFASGSGFKAAEDIFETVYEGKEAKSMEGKETPSWDQASKDKAFSVKDEDTLFSTASWTPERLKDLMRSYAYPNEPDRTKGYAAFIDPAEFTRLTAPIWFREGELAEKSKYYDDLEKIKSNYQTPYLTIVELGENKGNVVGHEGRHRMTALKRRGVEKVPVVINARVGTNREQIKTFKLFGQGEQRPIWINISNLEPISYANEQKLIEKFTGKDVQFSYTDTHKWSKSPLWVATRKGIDKTQMKKGTLEKWVKEIKRVQPGVTDDELLWLGLWAPDNDPPANDVFGRNREIQKEDLIKFLNYEDDYQFLEAGLPYKEKFSPTANSIYKRLGEDESLGYKVKQTLKKYKDKVSKDTMLYNLKNNDPEFEDNQFRIQQEHIEKINEIDDQFNKEWNELAEKSMSHKKTLDDFLTNEWNKLTPDQKEIWKSKHDLMIDRSFSFGEQKSELTRWREREYEKLDKWKQEQSHKLVDEWFDSPYNAATQHDAVAFMVDDFRGELSNQNISYKDIDELFPTEEKLTRPRLKHPSTSYWSTTDDRVELRVLFNPNETKEDGRSLFLAAGHWEEPNVIGWFRGGSVFDKDGIRLFYIDEVQSDWHQKLRDEGVRTEQRKQENRAKIVEYDQYFSKMQDWARDENIDITGVDTGWDLYNQAMSTLFQEERLTDSKRKKLREFADATYKYYELSKLGQQDAPMKGNRWIEMMIRRAIKYAADNDYEGIAWTPALVQAKRWSSTIENAIHHIVVVPSVFRGDRNRFFFSPKQIDYLVKIYSNENEHRTDAEVNYDDLAKILPADELKQIEEKIWEYSQGNWGNFEISGAKLGGKIDFSGFGQMYDETIPNFLKKFLKQFGGTIQKAEGISTYTYPSHYPIMEKRQDWVSYFTPALKKVAAEESFQLSIAPALKLKARETIDKVIPYQTRLNTRIALWDKYAPIYDLTKDAMKATGHSIKSASDVYNMEALFHGRTGERQKDAVEKLYNPALQFMKKHNISLGEMSDYMLARHAEERRAWFKNRNPKMEQDPDLAPYYGPGVTKEWVAERLRAFKADKRPFEEAAKQFDKIIADTNAIRENYGLQEIDPKDDTKFKHYVPLWGDEVDPTGEYTSSATKTGKGYSVKGKEDRTAYGRTSKPNNVIENLIMQHDNAIVRSQKNRVAQSFLNFVNEYGHLFTVPDRHGKQVPMFRINPVEVVPFKAASGMIYYRPDQRFNDPNKYIHVKVKGKYQVVEVEHGQSEMGKKVAMAMNNQFVGNAMSSGFFEALAKVGRYFSAINTAWNPDYLISNYFRDLGAAGINALQYIDKSEIPTLINNSRKALVGISKWYNGNRTDPYAKSYEELRLAGGTTAYLGLRDLKHHREEINRLLTDIKPETPWQHTKQIFHWIKDKVDMANSIAENANRVSIYKTLRDKGVSKDRAAAIAKNITINFNRRGAYGPVLNSLYIFYNASFQGSVIMIRALHNRKVQLAAGAMALAAFGLDWMNAFLSPDSDDDGIKDYDMIPQWKKDTSIIFYIGGEAITIPMPYGYNVFHVFGRSMAEVLRGVKSPGEAAMQTVLASFDAFNPIGGAKNVLNIMSPTATDIVVDIKQNKDFTGKPIAPDSSPFGPDKPASDRYWSSTGAPWIAVSDFLSKISGGTTARPGWIEVSPDHLEYFLGWLTGGAGRTITRAAEMGAKISNGDYESAAQDLIPNVPFLRRLTYTPGSRDRTNYYTEALDDILLTKEGMRLAKEDKDKDEIARIREEEGDQLRIMNRFIGFDKRLDDLRSQRRKIESNERIDPSLKKQRIDNIDKRIKELTIRANKLYHEEVES